MINMLKNIDKQLINRWLNMSLIIMFVGAAVLSYLGGNLNLFHLNIFIVIWIICALPFLFVAVTMYIQADKQKKSYMRLQFYFILIFIIGMTIWRLVD
ncbi:hypothetical protein ACFSGI_03550 [Paenibacillus nicotianae]|uniref:Uncharacterized protein n=1 Tax=Paenibacillus nicotianae TaxID=1526551 RepID=A0ABW4UR28_9BACL